MGYYGYGDGYGMGYGGYGFFGPFDLIIHILVIVFIVWVVFAVLRGFGIIGRGKRWNWHSHNALSILNERFAKGEIDKAEFEERRKALLGEK